MNDRKPPPGSGPPTPDLILDAIRDGASFVIVRGELGGLDVGGVVQRLLLEHDVWRLDPDAGACIDKDTFRALAAWAALPAHSLTPPARIGDESFGLALLPDSVRGMPIARVVIAPFVGLVSA